MISQKIVLLSRKAIEDADFSWRKDEFENLFLWLKSYRDIFSVCQLILEGEFFNRKISIIEARSSSLHESSGLGRITFL